MCGRKPVISQPSVDLQRIHATTRASCLLFPMKLHAWGMLALIGCATSPADTVEQRTVESADGLDLLDDTGRPLTDRPIEVGEDLGITVRGLDRDTDHTLVVIDDDTRTRLFTLAVPSNASGTIDHALLWPDLGLGNDRESEWFASRELARAQERLAGRHLRVVVEVDGRAVRERSLVVAKDLAKPRVFALDDRGQITHTVGESGILQLVGSHLAPGLVDVMLVANRAEWRDGDVVEPAKAPSGEPLMWRAEIGSRGELAMPLDTRKLLPGAFQIIVMPAVKPGTILRLDSRWVLAKELAPGIVIPQPPPPPYWPGASIRLADVSTRANAAAPYFTPEDVFLTGEPIWATLDLAQPFPTHGAGITSKVRFYVVPHRTATEWRTNAPLVDVSGHVVEALVTLGGTTGNRALIGSALPPGRYDIVVDTGNQPLNPSGFVSDDHFDAAADYVDGVTRVGFTIVDDPLATGPYAVGSTQYQAASVTYPQYSDVYPNPPPITTRVVGEVRYPAITAGDNTAMASGTFPVVVVAHGNTLDYRGHDQLLAHLASHGYIAVSIDLIDLSFALPPIDLRARLILEHVDLLSRTARQPSVLKNHVDTANITLLGHSRGGDAVLRAAYMAKRDGLAFHPRAVIAIAPTDGSGMPYLSPDPSVINVPYLALYGNDDGDVGGIGPNAAPTGGGTAFRAYDRNIGPKAMVFIERACHNLFNEERQICESVGSGSTGGNLSRTEHLQLLRGYATAFLAWHVQGDSLQRVFFETGMLRDLNVVAHHQLHDPTARTLDDFEDAKLSTNTAGGMNFESGFAGVAEDPLWMLDGSSPHASIGRLMRWTAPAEHLLRMPQAIDVTAQGDAVLSVRFAQAGGLIDSLNASAAGVAPLDSAQLTQQVRDWITLHNGTVLPGAYVVVETPGSRWRVMNGAQHLRLVFYPGLPAGYVSLAIRNADIAEIRGPLPIRLRVGDVNGVTRTIRVVVPAPVIPSVQSPYALAHIERRTLAALETFRVPIAAFAIPDASGPGIDPRQLAHVAIELDAPRGELLVDDIEIGP